MQHSGVKAYAVLCLCVAISAESARAQPSAERCASGGGPTICVRFDNVGAAPQEDFDYRFDVVTDPANPSVQLLRGRHPQETLYAWRVWSKDAQEDPANIGGITSPGEYDYDVKILNPAGEPGAANVAQIDLRPAETSKYSNLTDGRISGNLTGDLWLQRLATGEGGDASFTIDGNAEGNMWLDTVFYLSVGQDFKVG